MIPDVNVLVAASRRDHPHHLAAHGWLDGALDAAADGMAHIGLPPMVSSGFLRLVTHSKVFVEPTPAREAWAFFHALKDSPGVELLPLGAEWQRFERLCTQHDLVGNAIPDAWIAAVAMEQRMPVVTLDRGFRRLLPHDSLILLDTQAT